MHRYTNNAPQLFWSLALQHLQPLCSWICLLLGQNLSEIFPSYFVLIQVFNLEKPIQTTWLMYHSNDKSQSWVFITHFRT